MTEPTGLEAFLLVVGGCDFFTLLFVTLVLQVTIGIRMHRQEGCLGMLFALHGTHVLLTGWRRVDEFEIHPLMIAYSICLGLLVVLFCGMLVFLAATGQLE